MASLLWVCLGGAVGSGARYLVSVWLLKAAGPGFAWGTLLVNVTGSFLLAVVMQLGAQSVLLSPNARLMLATGVMGGFTTFSTFSFETVGYLQAGAHGMALINVAANLFGCIAATLLGLAVVRWGAA